MLCRITKYFLPQKLEESIKRVIRERNTPSMFVKTYVYATYDKLDENLYKINVVASVTIETEKGIFFIQNEPESVAYATAAELGITVFNKKPDQNEVNNIANQVLSYAKMEIKVDD